MLAALKANFMRMREEESSEKYTSKNRGAIRNLYESVVLRLEYFDINSAVEKYLRKMQH